MNDPIQHVVLLMMENRSFDHMLGALQSVNPDIDGVKPDGPPNWNPVGANNDPVYQTETTANCVRFDPKHEHVNVMRQLADGNKGFVLDFFETYKHEGINSEDIQDIMRYYRLDHLPALHALARDFTVCDRWFSSLPGPTWPNRFFALSGTSSGIVTMPSGVGELNPKAYFQQNQTTIFDLLDAQNVSWNVFYYDIPSSLIMVRQRRLQNLAKYRKMDCGDDFFKLAARYKNTGDFPRFSFIEPKYFGTDQNDDHPPHNIMKGEKLIADTYNALRSNPALWQSTLLVVVFDEHGGFYDHVPPPVAIPPAPPKPGDEWVFDRLGVRIPAILVSPWVNRGVEHTPFDHTSVLKYLIEKWSLGAPDCLGDRTASANSIARVLDSGADRPREDTTAFIRVPFSQLIPDKSELDSYENAVNENQASLHLLADFIDEELDQPNGGGIANVASALSKEEKNMVSTFGAFRRLGLD